jgi:hypothetical protein
MVRLNWIRIYIHLLTYLLSKTLSIFSIYFSSDPNAIRLLYDGNHIGHVNREVAAVLSPLMDLSSSKSLYHNRFKSKNGAYGIYFKMHRFLFYCDTNHSRSGYRMQIIVDSTLSTEWVEFQYWRKIN